MAFRRGKTAVTAVFLLACFFATVSAAPPNLSPPVFTTNGVVIGQRVSVGGIEVYEFDAIPYAEPPTGTNRFKKTQPKENWPNALLCLFAPPACPQVIPTQFGPNFPGTSTKSQFTKPNITMSEDCLYLNMWVPRAALDQLYWPTGLGSTTPPPSHLNHLPVLIYFHGGHFQQGSATPNLFNGTVLSAFNNIIVITVQSRIGPLGYLYTGTEDAPGNQGLWDQLEAMKWICENIESFGGNCSQTTIAGQGSGGSSVSYHLLSPYSRRYFQRAILESATALSDWSYYYPSEARSFSNKMAQVLSSECNDRARITSDTTAGERMTCLRSIDAIKFPPRQISVAQTDDAGSPGIFPFTFIPVIDGDFVPRSPLEMMRVGDFYNVSILAGVNKDEGSLAVQTSTQGLKLLPNPLVLNRTFDNFDAIAYEGFIKSYFTFYPRNGIRTFPVIQEGIRLIYSALQSDGEIMMAKGVIDKVVQAVGDWAYTCPTILWADAYADAPDDYKVRVFLYYFNHRSSQDPWPEWTGISHGAELPFVFGEPFANYAQAMDYTDEEKLLSRVIMAYWSNFAKFGDPNRPDLSSRNQANTLSLRPWPEYDNALGRMAAVLNVETRVRQEGNGAVYALKRRECVFWSFLSRVHEAITIAELCGREPANMILMTGLGNITTLAPAAAAEN